MPGRSAANPFFLRRARCGSVRIERLLSAAKAMLPGGRPPRWPPSVSSKRTPKFGSCQPTFGRFCFVRRNRRSSFRTSRSSGWYGTVESMQKLHVYGQPRLASIGTSFRAGALRRVGSMNFQRSRTPGRSSGWRAAETAAAERAVRGAVGEDVAEDRPVGEPEDVVEVARRVFREAAGVGAAEGGHRAPGTEEAAQGVGGLRGLGEGADEDEVRVGRQLRDEVLEARVADVGDVVPFGLAPGGNDLRHDARQVRVHDPGVERFRGPLADEVDDADSELAHGRTRPHAPCQRNSGGMELPGRLRTPRRLKTLRSGVHGFQRQGSRRPTAPAGTP